jgi:thioredoxin-dependent peroxiredoxin
VTELKQGDPAPPFSLPDQSAQMVNLTDYRGRRLLLYFYPKAETSGCTVQALAVRDAKNEFAALGAEVLGISPDTPERLRGFDAHHGLGFPLLSDPNHAVADAYGVWGEKSLYGNRFFGVIRSAFLIGPDGRVQASWYRVSPGQTVPKALKELARQSGPAG